MMNLPVVRTSPRGSMRREIYRAADKFARNPERFERRIPARLEAGIDYLHTLASLWHTYGRQVVCMTREQAHALIETPLRPPTFEPQTLAIEVAIPPNIGIQCEHGDDLQSIFLVDLRAEYDPESRTVGTCPDGLFGACRIFRACSGDTTATIDDMVRDNGAVARLIGHTLQRLQDTGTARRRPVRMRHGMPTTQLLWLWDEAAIGGLMQPQRDEQDEEFGTKLRRLDKRDVQSLEPGDTVYEPIAYGGRTKYKELRVDNTEGGEAVRVTDPERKQRPRSIMFSKLMIAAVQPVRRLVAVPATAAAAPRQSVPPPLDDDDRALLELSREKLAKVDREIAELKDRRAGLRAETDATHDKRIAQLEAQIKTLEIQIGGILQERDHDRKIAQKTRSELDEQIEYLEGRRNTLRQYIEASEGGQP
jgi:hypothetical protein